MLGVGVLGSGEGFSEEVRVELVNLFYYESKFRIIFFGGGGGGAR